MNFAVIDTIKWEDLPNDNHSSKNICIPLQKDLLLTILNKKKISESTQQIKLKIAAEPDFNPLTDINIESLRFGSYNEVNFGRGAKVIKHEKNGNDLIVVFDGRNSGITVDEFAPKLIGRNNNDEMIFGYAKLPDVDYSPAILSSCKPNFDKENQTINLKIDNFGLSNAKNITIEIESDGKIIGKTKINKLEPYQQKDLSIKSKHIDIEDIKNIKLSFVVNNNTIYSNSFN